MNLRLRPDAGGQVLFDAATGRRQVALQRRLAELRLVQPLFDHQVAVLIEPAEQFQFQAIGTHGQFAVRPEAVRPLAIEVKVQCQQLAAGIGIERWPHGKAMMEGFARA